MMIPNKLYSVSEIAELLGVTERTVRNYIAQGLLRGKKIGAQWRFTEEDVMNLLENRQIAPEGGDGGDVPPELAAINKKAAESINTLASFSEEDDDIPIARACMAIDYPAAEEAVVKAAAERAMNMLATVTTDIIPTCDYVWVRESGCVRFLLTGTLEQVAKMTKVIRKG